MELVKYNGNLKSELFRFTTECFAELGKSFEPYGRHSFYNEIDNYKFHESKELSRKSQNLNANVNTNINIKKQG